MTGAVIAAVIILLASLAIGLIFRKKTVVMLMIAPLYGLIIGGMVLYLSDKDQQACIATANGRTGNRAMWVDLLDRLSDRGLPDDADFLRIRLDANLEAKDVHKC